MTGVRRLGDGRPGLGRSERFLARPWRLAAIVLALVGIPVTGLSVSQIHLTREDLRSQVLAQTTEIARHGAVIVDDRVVALRDALAAVTADPDLVDAAAARDGVALVAILHRARGAIGPDVGDVAVLDVDGRYVAGSPFRPELMGKAAAGAAAFVAAVLSAGPSVAGPGADGLPAVSVSTPIRTLSGSALGIATANVELPRLAGWLAPLLGSVDDVYLVDARARLIVRAREPRQRDARDLGGDPVIRGVIRGTDPRAEVTDPISGRPALMATRVLPTTGWHIVTASSLDRIDRQLGPLATSFLATTILLVALLLGAAILLAHTSARVLEALRHQALTDPLTGLYNRRFMNEQLAVFDSLAQRHGRPYSVIALDLDGLKRINDLFGHEAGDELIRGFGALLRRCVRESDIAIRLGGDEFVAILPETSMADATAAFERVRAAVKQWADDPRRAVTVSAGAVTWHAGREPDELVQVADEMLYRAKREGRDRIVAEPPAA